MIQSGIHYEEAQVAISSSVVVDGNSSRRKQIFQCPTEAATLPVERGNKKTLHWEGENLGDDFCKPDKLLVSGCI